jgi:hypothetical protein
MTGRSPQRAFPFECGAAWVVVALALSCAAEPDVIEDCVPGDGIELICGFQNPEDLAVLPGGTWVVASQFPGARGGGGGSLVAFRPADGRKQVLFPDPDSEEPPAADAPDPGWGAADCPGPPDPGRFGPHGIDLDRRSHRLAVVNHGDREAVELFEVGHSRRGPVAVWRGCVPLPEGDWANDVALLPDGRLLVTRMLGQSGADRVLSFARILVGGETGWVLAWSRDDGWRKLEGSEGAGPNGIVVSPDGRDIYFAEWSGSRLVRLRLDGSGEIVEREQVDLPHHPDNISWTRNGELLVTGQKGPIGEVLACGETEKGTCALPFSVVRVGAGTFDLRVVFEHDPATRHGAGTVAIEYGDTLLIGTFDGDRVARVRPKR